MSTKLKLLGVDVASFGDAFGTQPGAQRRQPLRQRSPASTRSWSLSADRKRLLGGILVGDASALRPAARSSPRARSRCPPQPEELILPPRVGGEPRRCRRRRAARRGAPSASCHNVTKGAICTAIRDAGAGRGRRGQDLHQGGHRLRLVRAAGRRAAQARAEARRRRRSPTTSASTSRTRARSSIHLVRLHEHQDASTRSLARHGRGTAARSASPRWRRSSPRPGTSTCSTTEHLAAAGHQRPLPGQHPARRHATRWCRACRAARSRPTS